MKAACPPYLDQPMRSNESGDEELRRRVSWIPIKTITDQRGHLVVFEEGTSLPFAPVRTFVISQVPPDATRANHAVSCDLVLVALQGQCTMLARYGNGKGIYQLVSGGDALLLRRDTWISLSNFSAATLLLVLASNKFAETKYAVQPTVGQPRC